MNENINVCYLINERFHDLTLKSINYIRKFFKSEKYNLKFYIITYDDLESEFATYIKVDNSLPLCHMRVRIPELLNVEKCIYLDSDTICMTCISKLWELDISTHLLGVVKHYYFDNIGDMFDLYRLPLTAHERLNPCFNCGVMVFNCRLWLDNNIPSECFKQFDLYKGSVHARKDEPGVNLALANRVKFLDEVWNYHPRYTNHVVPNILHYYGDFTNDKCGHHEF